MALHLDVFMDLVVHKNADELHIQPGVSPRVLLGGKMRPLYMPPLKPEETLQLLGEIAPKERLHELESTGSCEFSFSFEGLALFRVSARMAEGRCGFVLHLEGTYLSSAALHLPITDLDRRLSRRLDLPLKPYSSNLRLARSVWDFASGFGLRSEVVESDGRKVLKAWNLHSPQKYERPMRNEADLPGELCRFILDILEGTGTRSTYECRPSIPLHAGSAVRAATRLATTARRQAPGARPPSGPAADEEGKCANLPAVNGMKPLNNGGPGHARFHRLSRHLAGHRD